MRRLINNFQEDAVARAAEQEMFLYRKTHNGRWTDAAIEQRNEKHQQQQKRLTGRHVSNKLINSER